MMEAFAGVGEEEKKSGEEKDAAESESMDDDSGLLDRFYGLEMPSPVS